MKAASLFLLVPLAWGAFAFLGAVPQQAGSAQEWRQTDRTDAVRGAYSRYSLEGKFLKTPPGEVTSRPSLVVDCSSNNRSGKSKFVRGTLVVGDPLKIDWVEPEEIHGISYFPKVLVVYRLDEGKQDKEDWSPANDKTSATFSKGSLEKMLRAHTVEISAEDARGSQVAMQFDMPGGTVVEQGCDVDHKK
jgi:hypothetical protein